eukprot:2260198-Pleurochrysis_carterae.AAC.1
MRGAIAAASARLIRAASPRARGEAQRNLAMRGCVFRNVVEHVRARRDDAKIGRDEKARADQLRRTRGEGPRRQFGRHAGARVREARSFVAATTAAVSTMPTMSTMPAATTVSTMSTTPTAAAVATMTS